MSFWRVMSPSTRPVSAAGSGGAVRVAPVLLTQYYGRGTTAMPIDAPAQVPGALMIVGAYRFSANSPAIPAPAGWTTLHAGYSGAGSGAASWFWKFYEASDGASLNIDALANANVFTFQSFSGADTSNPVVSFAHAAKTDYTSDFTFPAIVGEEAGLPFAHSYVRNTAAAAVHADMTSTSYATSNYSRPFSGVAAAGASFAAYNIPSWSHSNVFGCVGVVRGALQ